MMRTLTLMMLAIATVAAAQSGPAPGYDDAASYAVDYAQIQAANATADPVTYAENKAQPEALGAEAGHAAYVACWAADDLAGSNAAGLCDEFYVAPGSVEPDEEANELPDEAEEVLDDVDAFSNETLGAVDDILADPAQAPAAAQRILDAAVALVSSIADTALGAAAEVLDILGLQAEASLGSIEVLADTLERAGVASLDAGAAGLDASVEGVSTAADETQRSAKKAAEATGDALEGAATAVADAVTNAVDAIQETVAGWFGADASSKDDRREDLDLSDELEVADNELLAPVTDLIR